MHSTTDGHGYDRSICNQRLRRNWDYCDGRSMATPHTTAVVTLIWSTNPTMTADAVETTLKNNCNDLGAAGYDTRQTFCSAVRLPRSNCVFGLSSAGSRSRRNIFGTSLPDSTACAASSPTAGESLKPWPEPPPRSQTFLACGWRSTMRLPSGLFSYWQTSADSSGAFASAGKRSARNARALSIPAGVPVRFIVVGSTVAPRVSSAILNQRPSMPGMP